MCQKSRDSTMTFGTLPLREVCARLDEELLRVGVDIALEEGVQVRFDC